MSATTTFICWTSFLQHLLKKKTSGAWFLDLRRELFRCGCPWSTTPSMKLTWLWQQLSQPILTVWVLPPGLAGHFQLPGHALRHFSYFPSSPILVEMQSAHRRALCLRNTGSGRVALYNGDTLSLDHLDTSGLRSGSVSMTNQRLCAMHGLCLCFLLAFCPEAKHRNTVSGFHDPLKGWNRVCPLLNTIPISDGACHRFSIQAFVPSK